MKQDKPKYRQPTAEEQQVLEGLTVRLVTPAEIERFNQLIVQEHYLHNAHLVGEHLRYVATWQGQWLALASWSAAAWHLKARDHFIGWSPEQRRKRLTLLANNARLLVLPQCHYPNLVSRFMKLMLGRLSQDWETAWQHPIALVETFVDPQRFQGTAYRVSGWSKLGHTSGWKRCADDFYEQHDQPKQIWVRELAKKACVKLRAAQLPLDWAKVEAKVVPRCTAKVGELTSLMSRLQRDVPEFRRQQALAYPLAGVLALIALAMFSGVAKGYEDLAEYAATLSQGGLRALGFRFSARTKRIRCPKKSVFERVLAQVDEAAIQKVLLLWQQQVLGLVQAPAQDPLVIFDGKEIRHADVELVSAVNSQGVWLGTVGVGEGTNEIPAARALLPRLDLAGKTVLADAAHTQVETTRQILFEGGGDYLLTAKGNQKELVKTLETLLAEQRFSP
jgi:Domain of unknown function (DUF4338)/DDE_Tnp_1-associated